MTVFYVVDLSKKVFCFYERLCKFLKLIVKDRIKILKFDT